MLAKPIKVALQQQLCIRNSQNLKVICIYMKMTYVQYFFSYYSVMTVKWPWPFRQQPQNQYRSSTHHFHTVMFESSVVLGKLMDRRSLGFQPNLPVRAMGSAILELLIKICFYKEHGVLTFDTKHPKSTESFKHIMPN